MDMTPLIVNAGTFGAARVTTEGRVGKLFRSLFPSTQDRSLGT
ncbi:MAG: hypothetical protein K1060chlam5_00571 [Candidatus Anoxychlamydiales bacterium]|nr:hypothetical protein [Candidatus Anoxychlamydiales bacterium]